MESSRDQISSAQAQEAINVVVNTKKRAYQAIRAPIWFLLLLTLSLAIQIFCVAFDIDNQIGWVTRLRLSATAMTFLICGIGFIQLRKNGVKPSFAANSRVEKVVFACIFVFCIALAPIGSYMFNQGIVWAPYAVGLLSFVGFTYIFYRYPAI